jgi:hypothetical protein
MHINACFPVNHAAEFYSPKNEVAGYLSIVTPAKAGVQSNYWIPAFVGMTIHCKQRGIKP